MSIKIKENLQSSVRAPKCDFHYVNSAGSPFVYIQMPGKRGSVCYACV